MPRRATVCRGEGARCAGRRHRAAAARLSHSTPSGRAALAPLPHSRMSAGRAGRPAPSSWPAPACGPQRAARPSYLSHPHSSPGTAASAGLAPYLVRVERAGQLETGRFGLHQDCTKGRRPTGDGSDAWCRRPSAVATHGRAQRRVPEARPGGAWGKSGGEGGGGIKQRSLLVFLRPPAAVAQTNHETNIQRSLLAAWPRAALSTQSLKPASSSSSN